MRTQHYDMLADLFFRHTGHTAPGRDAPAALCRSDEEIDAASVAWAKWDQVSALCGEINRLRKQVASIKGRWGGTLPPAELTALRDDLAVERRARDEEYALLVAEIERLRGALEGSRAVMDLYDACIDRACPDAPRGETAQEARGRWEQALSAAPSAEPEPPRQPGAGDWTKCVDCACWERVEWPSASMEPAPFGRCDAEVPGTVDYLIPEHHGCRQGQPRAPQPPEAEDREARTYTIDTFDEAFDECALCPDDECPIKYSDGACPCDKTDEQIAAMEAAQAKPTPAPEGQGAGTKGGEGAHG